MARGWDFQSPSAWMARGWDFQSPVRSPAAPRRHGRNQFAKWPVRMPALPKFMCPRSRTLPGLPLRDAKRLGSASRFAESWCMKQPAVRAAQSKAPVDKTRPRRTGKIHPIIIYPFQQPGDDTDLDQLYQMVARLDADKDQYARPV